MRVMTYISEFLNSVVAWVQYIKIDRDGEKGDSRIILSNCSFCVRICSECVTHCKSFYHFSIFKLSYEYFTISIYTKSCMNRKPIWTFSYFIYMYKIISFVYMINGRIITQTISYTHAHPHIDILVVTQIDADEIELHFWFQYCDQTTIRASHLNACLNA